jgi:hypothetical protein
MCLLIVSFFSVHAAKRWTFDSVFSSGVAVNINRTAEWNV